MNKTKFFSSLLVAVLFATTSVFVSCKDYDDDIKNLQSQIDKAALKADLDALSTKLAGVESTANAAKTTAENALAKANANATEIAAVKATAEKAAKDAAEGLVAVAKAQNTADAAAAAAAAAQKTADDAVAAAAAAQKTADEAKALGEAAATKVELAAAKKELDDAIDKLQKAVENLDAVKATKVELADAKTELKAYTDAAKEAALAAAKLAADAAAAAQSTADGAVAAAGKNAEAITGINKTIETLATQTALETLSTELNKEITGLKTTLAGITGVEEMAELVEIIGNFDTVVETLFSAITSIELVESYTNSLNSEWRQIGQDQWYNDTYLNLTTYLDFYHGFITEDSKFGDNEAYTAADQQIEYKKGADIKDEASFLVRVSPANADLAAADIKLINTKGEDLEGIVELAGVERYNELITTRGVTNTGLWKVTYKPVDGITEEAFNKAVWTINKNTQALQNQILFAIAANNTAEASADRYAVSSYDIALWYGEYQPATAFRFTVNDTRIANIRNRWNNNLQIQAEQQNQTSTNNPELAWNPVVENIPATAPDALDEDNEKCNVVKDNNTWYQISGYNYREKRRSEHFIYADVNEEFVIDDIYGNTMNAYRGQQIDYYYVVFDKGNAIESAPSEWNAWNSYTVEGLGVMTKATESLTMKITSPSAHGDVVGFRVYAVNRDGTLADPDGRAFYVFVGKPGEENKAASANIIATKAQPDSEEMDVTGWFKGNTYYYFSARDEDDVNNQTWYNSANNTELFGMNHAILKFYKKGEKDPYYTIDVNGTSAWANGADIKDAVKVVFTPKATIAGMLNDATYTIYIRQDETHIDDTQTLPYATLSITKVMPTTAKTLEFRPKQEGDWNEGKWVSKDGTGKFMAYMIPNENQWITPWAETYPQQTSDAVYVATPVKDNGFKDLNNVFYNLNTNTDIEFFFANSLKKNNKIVDLMDDDKNGIVYRDPAVNDMRYILDVATEFIDGKTEHAVTTYTNYDLVSTYIEKTNGVETVHYAETWSVKSDQSLTAIYACWHHAMHTIEFWKTKDNKEITDIPELQWTATGANDVEKTFEQIRTKNSYNNDYFGLKLNELVTTKQWLTYVDNSAELNTKADGTGQKNPYFKPVVNNGNITFTQNSVQVDANPTADHDEYLVMKFKDAFDHEVLVSAKVLVKKAATAAPRL